MLNEGTHKILVRQKRSSYCILPTKVIYALSLVGNPSGGRGVCEVFSEEIRGTCNMINSTTIDDLDIRWICVDMKTKTRRRIQTCKIFLCWMNFLLTDGVHYLFTLVNREMRCYGLKMMDWFWCLHTIGGELLLSTHFIKMFYPSLMWSVTAIKSRWKDGWLPTMPFVARRKTLEKKTSLLCVCHHYSNRNVWVLADCCVICWHCCWSKIIDWTLLLCHFSCCFCCWTC